MTTSLTVRPSSAGRTIVEFPQVQNVFADFDVLTNEIAKRAFGFFEQRNRADGLDMDDWFRAESEMLRPMPIELIETDANYSIRAEVPGFEAKDIEVRVEPTSIYIHGKSEQKKEEKKGKEVKYSEVSSNELCRRIDLPTSIDTEKVTAQVANGVLELTMPKAAPPKMIPVKAA